MHEIFFCQITAVYYLCFKCKMTITVIPSFSRTMKKEIKDVIILEFIPV